MPLRSPQLRPKRRRTIHAKHRGLHQRELFWSEMPGFINKTGDFMWIIWGYNEDNAKHEQPYDIVCCLSHCFSVRQAEGFDTRLIRLTLVIQLFQSIFYVLSHGRDFVQTSSQNRLEAIVHHPMVGINLSHPNC